MTAPRYHPGAACAARSRPRLSPAARNCPRLSPAARNCLRLSPAARNRLRLVTVLIVAAGAAPAPATAAAPATSIASSNVVGPSTTFSEVVATTDCGGRLVSGGGTRLAQSTPTVTHNGIRLYASTPSPGADTASASGELDPTRWLSSGGSGGGVPNDAQTLGYAVCLDAGVAGTQVVTASTPGPAGTFETVHATATCPLGTRLLGGGARTTPGTVGSLKPNGSFPSDAAGTPLPEGANPSSWTAAGLNGGGGDQGNTTHAFALCATGAALPNVGIAHARVPGPAAASSAAQATASCPAGSTLLGGGGFVSDAFGLPGSQGDHLTGSYPSDAEGTPVASGGAASWTSASHSGGVDSGSLTQTDVWAMCASAADTPAPVPPPPPGAALPSNTALPAIAGSARRGSVVTVRPGTWTNAPATYAYAWLRCSSDGNGCAAIAGARSIAYRLTLADAGARIRVRETASNAAGAGAPAVSAPTAIVGAGRVGAAEIRAELRRWLAPTGRSARIASLLARVPITLPFRALRSGRATISWYARRSKHKLLARGTRTFTGARATTIGIRLTPAGRRALGPARRLRLTAVGTFKAPGAKQVRVTKTFAVTH
jgi:hypothetical protein